MYAVNLLKRIVDVIHDEISTSDHKQLDEAEISDKDKVIAELYRINIQLENKLRLYEKDFDVFTALHPSVATSVKEEHDATMKDTKTKESVPASQPHQPQPQPQPQQPQQANTTHQPTHHPEKRDRREYMREYHKNYRKKNRENNIEMNL